MTRAVLAGALATVVVTCPQEAPQRPTFVSSADAVRVDVAVTDGRRPIAGLRAGDFELTDNGVTQTIDVVEPERASIAVSLVLDTSESVSGDRLRHLVTAAASLLGTLGPDDRASLVVFDDDVRELVAETGALDEVAREVRLLRPGGRTALNDAAFSALVRESGGDRRRLIVLFSDGFDNASWLARETVIEASRRADAVVYAVAVGYPRGAARLPRWSGAQGLIETLASATGGIHLTADRDRDLEPLFLRVVGEFRARYWLIYTPRGVATGDGWHTLSVRVRGRRATVQHRRGYESRRPAPASPS